MIKLYNFDELKPEEILNREVYCVNYCYCDNKISGFMDIFTGNSSGYLHMDVCIWNGNDFMCFSDGF